MYGYAGKIARINLSSGEVTEIPTSNYLPDFIGGRGICNKIFWDEVPPGVKAFDPENKLIFMTGPTTGTGIPTGGRTVFGGIAPNSLPEQYCWSGIGGWFGAELKFAGFDGFILEGKAPQPSFIFVNNDEISIRPAGDLWGMLVHDTQIRLEEMLGKEVKSIVIGPAGENMVRIASITSSSDNVAAKSGFGAVFGSKNLKAVSVRGTGVVAPAHVDQVLALRKKMGKPQNRLNPIEKLNVFAPRPHIQFPVPEGIKQAHISCSHGCNQHCNLFLIDVKSGIAKKGRTNLVNKCVGVYAYKFMNDCSWAPGQTFSTEKNDYPACMNLSGDVRFVKHDLSDPYEKEMFERRWGDRVGLWDGDYDRGNVINDLCTQYGIDRWDVVIWLMTWFAMGKREGILDDIDLGMEIDPASEKFMQHLLKMITYREGYYGNLFAEGMARAIRTLGKEKYGDTIFKGRFSEILKGQRLDIPVSFESAWGHCFHWLGRGFQGTINIAGWLPTTLEIMTSTRDAQTNTHHHDTYEVMKEVIGDPCHNPRTAASAIMNENKSELKEALTSCDWQSPNVHWTSMECEIYEAATGIRMSEGELDLAARRIKNLFRAILMRNFDRTRTMEVNEVFTFLTYPDSEGKTVTFEDFSYLVDLYYDQRGWDRKTGWPTRETFEKCGLKDIADELESLGKLP
jgi:aldehyde:ferredoxin oxidoreductase